MYVKADLSLVPGREPVEGQRALDGVARRAHEPSLHLMVRGCRDLARATYTEMRSTYDMGGRTPFIQEPICQTSRGRSLTLPP